MDAPERLACLSRYKVLKFSMKKTTVSFIFMRSHISVAWFGPSQWTDKVCKWATDERGNTNASQTYRKMKMWPCCTWKQWDSYQLLPYNIKNLRDCLPSGTQPVVYTSDLYNRILNVLYKDLEIVVTKSFLANGEILVICKYILGQRETLGEW